MAIQNRRVRFPALVMLLLPVGLWDSVPAIVSADEQSSVSPRATANAHTFRHAAMATEFVFRLYPPTHEYTTSDLRRIAGEAFEAIDDLEHRLSSWQPDSQVAYINAHAADRPVSASPQVLEAIQTAKAVHLATDGAFDITVRPLLELWGFYEGRGRIPSDAEIEEALAKTGMEKVVVEDEAGTVSFDSPGVQLDFGGIGKGIALDLAGEIIRGFGIESALLSGGDSTILAIGLPPGSTHWTVHVRNPYNAGTYIDTLPLAAGAFSSSGCYDEQLEADGERLCHILDPRTGRPVTGVLATGARAPSAAWSDALSTAFLVMGRDGIEAFCREYPEVGAVLVTAPDDGEPKSQRINLNARG